LVLLEVLLVSVLIDMSACVVFTLLTLVTLAELLARLPLLLHEQLSTGSLLVVFFVKKVFWKSLVRSVILLRFFSDKPEFCVVPRVLLFRVDFLVEFFSALTIPLFFLVAVLQ
jgi:hypothetical protein